MNKLKVYPRRLTSVLLMGCREKGQPGIVIDGDRLIEYVGIGWIELRKATKDDFKKFPKLI